MDNNLFNLHDTHQMVKDTCKSFATKELKKVASSLDESHKFPTDQIKHIASLGLMGITIPQEFGGAGLDSRSYAIAIEEISKGCASCGVIMSVNNSLYCEPIYKFGSQYLKEKYLTPFAKGEKLGCFALSEPQNGSDAAALKTTAKKTVNGYILNGTKAWVTNGYDAHAALILATTNIDLKHQGISAFIVPIPTKGLSLGKKEKKLGIRASSTCNIILEDCFIPNSHLLGNQGDGFKIAMSTLDSGRIGIASQAIGIAQAAFDEAVAYSKERSAFNKKLCQMQTIQNKIADMGTKIETSKLLIMKSAFLKDYKLPFTKFAAMAKLHSSETANFVTFQSLQIFGGNGYITDFPLERHFRDARITEIYEGTSEINRIVIAQSIIKEY